MNKWHQVLRVLSLQGGIVATNFPGVEVILDPSVAKNNPSFSISTYGSIFSELIANGFIVIGAKFYQDDRQIAGIYPPEWRTWFKDCGWLSFDLTQKWSQVSNSAFKKDKFDVMDNARRIAFEINNCNEIMKDICDSYHKEAVGVCEKGTYKEGDQFETQNSGAICRSVHHFLSTAGTLRDYLAEFLAKNIFHGIPHKIQKSQSMAALVREVEKKQNKTELEEDLVNSCRRDGEYGWLAKFSDYRNIVTHYAPLIHAERRGFLYKKTIEYDGSELCSVVFPLPREPNEVKNKRKKNKLYSNTTDWIKASATHRPSGDDIDGLLYCHDVYKKLLLLAKSAVEKSPYPPEQVTINPVPGSVRRVK